MKTIIAGGRDYSLTKQDFEYLDSLNITEVISGGARGADNGGEYYSILRNLDLTIFKANWNRYPRAAGILRNKRMAKYAEAVVLFPGGRGTDNMYEIALKYGLKIYDNRKRG